MESERGPEEGDAHSFENLETPERDRQGNTPRVVPPPRSKPGSESEDGSSDDEEGLSSLGNSAPERGEVLKDLPSVGPPDPVPGNEKKDGENVAASNVREGRAKPHAAGESAATTENPWVP